MKSITKKHINLKIKEKKFFYLKKRGWFNIARCFFVAFVLLICFNLFFFQETKASSLTGYLSDSIDFLLVNFEKVKTKTSQMTLGNNDQDKENILEDNDSSIFFRSRNVPVPQIATQESSNSSFNFEAPNSELSSPGLFKGCRDCIKDHHIDTEAIETDEIAQKTIQSSDIDTGEVNSRIIEDNTVDTRDLAKKLTIGSLRIGDGSASHFTRGKGDLYVQGDLEVDGTIFGNLSGSSGSTTYFSSGDLLTLTNNVFSVKAGTLVDGKLCSYDSTNGLVCNSDQTGESLSEDTVESYIFDSDAETISANWVNTANPWADNEVAEDLTISSSGSVADGALSSNVSLLGASIGFSELVATDIITQTESIASNDNDTTIPTSAAVKDYADSNDTNTIYSAESGLTLSSETFKFGGTLTEDTNLNLYGSAADRDLRFYNSDFSDELIFLDGSTGNIGIGTMNPEAKLHILETISTTDSLVDVLTVDAKSTGDVNAGFGPSILFKDFVGGSTAIEEVARIGAVYEDSSQETSGLTFYTNDNDGLAEKMRINNDGNVGIGTTDPGAQLEVQGSTADGSTNIIEGKDSNGSTIFNVNTNGNTHISQVHPLSDDSSYIELENKTISIYVDWSNMLHMDGNAGEMVVNPHPDFFDNDFMVQNYDTAVYDAIKFDQGDNTWTLNKTEQYIIGGQGQSAKMYFWADAGDDSADKWSIEASGSGLYFRDAYSSVDLALGYGSGIVVNESGNDDIDFRVESDNDTHAFFVDATDGNVGIGTIAPESKLSVHGTATDPIQTWWDSSGNALARLDSSGRLGIGTMSPQKKLHINSDTASTFLRISALDDGSTTGIEFHSLTGSGSTKMAYLKNEKGILKINTQSYSNVINLPDTGNVGIGTTNPTENLEVAGLGATMLINSVTSASASLDIENSLGAISIFTVNNGLGSMNTISSNGTLKINASDLVATGNVGIGATSSGYKLEVSTDSAGKPGGGSWSDSSDRRLKENITNLDNALEKITKLQGVSFNWVNPEEHGEMTGTQSSFIAQDLEEVFPEWVKEKNPSGNDKDLIPEGDKAKSINLPYAFDAYMVEAVKELDKKFTDHQLLTTDYGEKMEKLHSRLETQNSELQELTLTIENLNQTDTEIINTLANHKKRIAGLEEEIESQSSLVTSHQNNFDNEEVASILNNLGQKLAENQDEEGNKVFALTGSLELVDLKTRKIEAQEVKTAGVSAEKLELGSEAFGKGIIKAGETEVKINTSQIKESSNVLVTVIGDNQGKVLFVDEFFEEESFKVKFNRPSLEENIKFNWVIISKKEMVD